jgi:hypothetical protein
MPRGVFESPTEMSSRAAYPFGSDITNVAPPLIVRLRTLRLGALRTETYVAGHP